MEFSGPGEPLTREDSEQLLKSSGLGAPELWSVLSVETTGCGYLPDRRPKILFERHVFSRLTKHQFDADDPDISNPVAGGYGAAGAHQYDRLNAAMQLDDVAALQSASWGLGQIMGENFRAAGFSSVREMVDSMVASEDNQLLAMVSFMDRSKLLAPLKAHDWAGFARRYNGPNFAANNYDALLEHFFERFREGPLPDFTARMVQVKLTYRGFRVGIIDGVMGGATRRAIEAFQASKGLPQTGLIDDALVKALEAPASA